MPKTEPSWAQRAIKALNDRNKAAAVRAEVEITLQTLATEKETTPTPLEISTLTQHYYRKKQRAHAARANKERLDKELDALRDRAL